MESETPPSAGIYDFLGWIETNKKRVALGVGAIVAVGIIAGLLAWRSGQRESEAELALSSVKVSFIPGEVASAGTAEALAKIAEEYPKTSAGTIALLRSATAYFDSGNFAKAGEQFDRFLRTYPESAYVPQAVFGVAASLDAQGKVTEAIAKYNDFLRTYSGDPAAERARLSLARSYEKNNQPSQALEILTKSTNPQTGATASPEAQEKIRELFTKYPSLLPTNTAPAMPPAPNILTNFIRQTNAVRIPQATNSQVIATSGAPKILLNPTTPTPGK